MRMIIQLVINYPIFSFIIILTGVGLMVWSPISMGMISSDLPFIKAPSIKVIAE